MIFALSYRSILILIVTISFISILTISAGCTQEATETNEIEIEDIPEIETSATITPTEMIPPETTESLYDIICKSTDIPEIELSDMYIDMRERSLDGTLVNADDIPEIDNTTPYLVVVDIYFIRSNNEAAIISLIASITGDSSMYYSNGGGVIGGYGQEKTRTPAINLVSSAADYTSFMQEATFYPLPQEDQVTFYFITRNNGYAYVDTIENLRQDSSPFYQFYNEAHELISGLLEAYNK
jgi:hypothetical protein